jgi:hypothetical protein
LTKKPRIKLINSWASRLAIVSPNRGCVGQPGGLCYWVTSNSASFKSIASLQHALGLGVVAFFSKQVQLLSLRGRIAGCSCRRYTRHCAECIHVCQACPMFGTAHTRRLRAGARRSLTRNLDAYSCASLPLDAFCRRHRPQLDLMFTSMAFSNTV